MGTCIPSENSAHFHRHFDNGTAQLARSALLLSQEEEKRGLACEQLDGVDRHIGEVRELISKQVELVENDKLKGQNAERSQNLLVTLNDLLATYQIHRRRIIAALTG
jgi:signal transduction histidine kinase